MLVKTRREGGTISRKTPFIGYSPPSGARMTILNAPPGLRSTSQSGLVKVFGPHHFASSFGSVHALNTTLRGALKMRVMVSSRSANVFMSSALVIERSHGSILLACVSAARLRRDHCAFSQLIIHGVPKRSVNMPNFFAQKVSCNSICTVPSFDMAL